MGRVYRNPMKGHRITYEQAEVLEMTLFTGVSRTSFVGRLGGFTLLTPYCLPRRSQRDDSPTEAAQGPGAMKSAALCLMTASPIAPLQAAVKEEAEAGVSAAASQAAGIAASPCGEPERAVNACEIR
jgi:hypothetical protein